MRNIEETENITEQALAQSILQNQNWIVNKIMKCEDQAQQKRLKQLLIIVLKQMLTMMEIFNVQGFVFSVISKNGEIFSAASENLKDWWDEQVKTIYKMSPTLEPVSLYTLLQIKDTTLSSLLSALMPHCNPPQRRYPFENRVQAPWWPNGNEDWWGKLGVVDDQRIVPYKKPNDLKKVWKAGVLISVIKHLSPDFGKIRMVLTKSRKLQGKMSAHESQVLLELLRTEDMHCRVQPLGNLSTCTSSGCS